MHKVPDTLAISVIGVHTVCIFAAVNGIHRNEHTMCKLYTLCTNFECTLSILCTQYIL